MTGKQLIDSHRHCTIGVSSQEELIAQLDADGIERTVLFGFHGASFREDHAQDMQVERIFRKYPERIIPFLCDIDFTDPGFLSYVENRLSAGFFRGIGEILVGHEVMKQLYFTDVSLCDTRVIELCTLAGEKKVPVLVHVDPPYMDDFRKLVSACCTTDFICAHAAYDFLSPFGGKEQNPGEIDELLREFSNLYFDISHWKISPLYLVSAPWQDLLEKYCRRFLFGTDMTDSYLLQSVWMHGYKRILQELSEDAAHAVGKETVSILCKISGSEDRRNEK